MHDGGERFPPAPRTVAAVSPAAVTARAPVRAADAGGWTDTWFAGSGLVCSVAVGPSVGPAVEVTARTVAGPAGRVTIDATTFGDRYTYDRATAPGRHRLLEAAVAAWGPGDGAVEVAVASRVPPGSGLGTSAAVVVALIGALRALAGEAPDPDGVARAAHEVETGALGLQSGVQDQAAAAHGGALRITIPAYPRTVVERLAVPPAAWAALTDRLVTVYLGRPHQSSAVHTEVIAALGEDGGAARLDVLRAAAAAAAGALGAGDLAAYGAALTAATEGQRALHPALVSADADAVGALGRAHGARGWKVNGAGGAGGSVTLVAGPAGGDQLRAALAAAGRGWRVLDLRPTAHGLSVTPC